MLAANQNGPFILSFLCKTSYLQPGKCTLFKKVVRYLGYVVSPEGVSMDPEKVLAIQTFPIPTELKSLQSILGLASLFALTRKGAVFNWDQSCQQAFGKLKLCLTSAPVLAYPEFSIDFQLETDASGVGLGLCYLRPRRMEAADPSPL